MPIASKIFSVKSMGLGFIQDQFQSAPKKLDKSMDEGLNELALLVARESKRIVPVKTGLLRSMIFVRRLDFNKYEIVAATHYANYVEYGTWKMVARPYLRPALYRYSGTWQKKVLDRFERKTKGYFKRIGR